MLSLKLADNLKKHILFICSNILKLSLSLSLLYITLTFVVSWWI
jgi:hypothetical protein